ncbi:hypothetical protein RSAG8_04586, partial [Rhizoctonia solani AG-8 WAC10335]
MSIDKGKTVVASQASDSSSHYNFASIDKGKTVVASQASDSSSHYNFAQRMTRAMSQTSGITLFSSQSSDRLRRTKLSKINKSTSNVSRTSNDSDESDTRNRKVPPIPVDTNPPSVVPASQEYEQIVDATLNHDAPSMPNSQETIDTFTQPNIDESNTSPIEEFTTDPSGMEAERAQSTTPTPRKANRARSTTPKYDQKDDGKHFVHIMSEDFNPDDETIEHAYQVLLKDFHIIKTFTRNRIHFDVSQEDFDATLQWIRKVSGEVSSLMGYLDDQVYGAEENARPELFADDDEEEVPTSQPEIDNQTMDCDIDKIPEIQYLHSTEDRQVTWGHQEGPAHSHFTDIPNYSNAAPTQQTQINPPAIDIEAILQKWLQPFAQDLQSISGRLANLEAGKPQPAPVPCVTPASIPTLPGPHVPNTRTNPPSAHTPAPAPTPKVTTPTKPKTTQTETKPRNTNHGGCCRHAHMILATSHILDLSGSNTIR